MCLSASTDRPYLQVVRAVRRVVNREPRRVQLIDVAPLRRRLGDGRAAELVLVDVHPRRRQIARLRRLVLAVEPYDEQDGKQEQQQEGSDTHPDNQQSVVSARLDGGRARRLWRCHRRTCCRCRRRDGRMADVT